MADLMEPIRDGHSHRELLGELSPELRALITGDIPSPPTRFMALQAG
jgi:hypothetical protein